MYWTNCCGSGINVVRVCLLNVHISNKCWLYIVRSCKPNLSLFGESKLPSKLSYIHFIIILYCICWVCNWKLLISFCYSIKITKEVLKWKFSVFHKHYTNHGCFSDKGRLAKDKIVLEQFYLIRKRLCHDILDADLPFNCKHALKWLWFKFLSFMLISIFRYWLETRKSTSFDVMLGTFT